MSDPEVGFRRYPERRTFIGGSDARIIIGSDEAALIRLWQEKRGEIRPRGPVWQPRCPARGRYRAAQSALVRAQHRSGDQGHSAPDQASGKPLDGGDARWNGRADRCRVRGQVHAALVVLGRGGGRKAHGAGAAQHVGRQFQDGGAFNHYRRRKMGRDRAFGRSALPAPARNRRAKIPALR